MVTLPGFGARPLPRQAIDSYHPGSFGIGRGRLGQAGCGQVEEVRAERWSLGLLALTLVSLTILFLARDRLVRASRPTLRTA